MSFNKKLVINLPWLVLASMILLFSHEGVYGLRIMELESVIRYTFLLIGLCTLTIQPLIWNKLNFSSKVNLAGLIFCWINLFFYAILVNLFSILNMPPVYNMFGSILINGLSTVLLAAQVIVWLVRFRYR